ncbi:MAG: hypothetical protein Q8R17_01380 [bacterium]|nr:hypothetical protein [bacterium]
MSDLIKILRTKEFDPTKVLRCRSNEHLEVLEHGTSVMEISLRRIVRVTIPNSGDGFNREAFNGLKARGYLGLDIEMLDFLKKNHRSELQRFKTDAIPAWGTMLRLQPDCSDIYPVLCCHNGTWFWSIEHLNLGTNPDLYPKVSTLCIDTREVS